MKRRTFARVVATLLSISMLTTTALAAPMGGRGGRNNGKSENSSWSQSEWGQQKNKKDKNHKNNKWQQSQNPGYTEPEDTTASSDQQLLVVEDENTVENGEMLRASTYVLGSGSSAANTASVMSLAADANAGVMPVADDTTGTVLKYFPITMYDYNTDNTDDTNINNATHRVEVDNGVVNNEWQGIYFSGGAPGAESFTYTTSAGAHTDLTWAQVQSGTYYSDEACTTKVTVNEVTEGAERYTSVTVAVGDLWDAAGGTAEDTWYQTPYFYYNSYYKTYYPVYIIDYGYGYYYVAYEMQDNKYQIGYYGSSKEVSLYETAFTITGYTLTAGGETLKTLDGTDTSAKVGVTLYSTVSTQTTGSLPYAEWNWWNKDTGNNSNGQKTYTGLVESSLDANKDIVFTKPDGGIFNSDTSVKSIYTNVELPFVYENGTYKFDASVNGVYFHENEAQGSSGAAGSNTRLYFAEGNPQSWTGMNYGDGSTNLWAPFNQDNLTGERSVDYHFGMRTTIPFTMTANGRMNPTNDSSDPIKFSFSGDDDVWVFIDGQLVIDLGGIHNRLDATINFATNTVTYSESNASDAETGSYNDTNFALTQDLFGNLISQDRTTFAATDSHELTIFYLERGRGSSNCKIEFNLPMKDTVTVTKHADQSWSVDENGNEIISDLTDAMQTQVNNIDFGFTLYKSTDNGGTYSEVANTNYNLLNANGQVIATPSTDANGHFVLKNGQSARFVTTFAAAGTTYYVVEDNVADMGFVTPDFNFGGEAANGFVANDVSYTKGNLIPEQILDTEATENKSYEVTVYGGEESEDSLVFICENYWDAELPNPSVRPADDKIVIDYGLGVEIDVMANDVVYADKATLLSTVSGAGMTANNVKDSDGHVITVPSVTAGSALKYGTAEVKDGKIVYTLNKQLTGVEVLNYAVQVEGSITKTVGSEEKVVTIYETKVGTVYIIPATTMYYEENFSNLVTYTGTGWKELVTESAYTDTLQEPGVVGTVGDSPYGSDAAYLNDSHDSNGTSKYASTTGGAVKFEYTFTGTGTSFFARTTNNTGYMKVTVTDSEGTVIQSCFRDTVYLTEDDSASLYNIPVFTSDKLDYGTYTVTVIIAKENNNVGYHGEFWLDGIRVYEPLNTEDANYSVATSAYATDAEANMANETLRNKLIHDADVDENGNPVWAEDGNFVLFTDINGAMNTAEEYESIGPKEEVYLNNGQSVTFSLYDWDPNTNKLYLGMKAPTGSATVTVGTTEMTLSNAADCYYDITNCAAVTADDEGIKTATFTIKSGSGSLVSVTNIKVTGNFEFTIIEKTDTDVNGGEGEGSDAN